MIAGPEKYNLAKAFAGLKQAQEPERPSTQAPKRFSFESSSENLKAIGDSLGGPRLAPLPLQGTAKSRHPDFAAVKVFVRKRTHKAASRKWQDQGAGGDFSDLVERLLQMYLEASF